MGLRTSYLVPTPRQQRIYARAAFEPLAGGHGVKGTTAAGTDYVFLGPQRFAYRDGDVAFIGTGLPMVIISSKLTVQRIENEIDSL